MDLKRFSLIFLIFLIVGCSAPIPTQPSLRPPTLAPKTLPPTWTSTITPIPSASFTPGPTYTPTPTITSTASLTASPLITATDLTPSETTAWKASTVTPTFIIPEFTPTVIEVGNADQWLVSLPGIQYLNLESIRNGNIILLGVANPYSSRGRKNLLMQISPKGQILWQKSISPATFHSVLEVHDGGLVLMDDWTSTKLTPDGDFSWFINIEYTDQSEVSSYFPKMQSRSWGRNGESIVLASATTKSVLSRDGELIEQSNLRVSGQEADTVYWRSVDTHWRGGKIEYSGFWIVRGGEDQSAWLRTFNFDNLGSDVHSDDQEMIGTYDGGVFFAAAIPYLRDIARYISIWVVRLDKAGNILWQSALDGDIEEDLMLLETDDGGYLVLSSSSSYSDWPISKIRLIRLNSRGVQLWDRWYGDGENHLTPVGAIKTKDGGYLIAAHSSRTADLYTEKDLLLFKTDSSGMIKNCSWMDDSTLDPPEDRIPDSTLFSWDDAVSYQGDFIVTRKTETSKEYEDADFSFYPICQFP